MKANVIICSKVKHSIPAAAYSSHCTCVKYPADHAGDHDCKEGQNFEVRSQQGASFCMGQGLGSQRALHNDLQRVPN